MDEQNIIIPTSSLEELEAEIDSWRKLPHNLRVISNQACNNKYGCDMEGLYNKIKVAILNSMVVKDPNNIKMESVMSDIVISELDEFMDREDYNDILSLSRQIQQSPYIVIIDPCDLDTEILIQKRNSFNMLNQKFRIFSNDYSVQLWGYNVPTMFDKMSAKIEDINAQLCSPKGNIKIENEAMMPLINKAIHNIANGDQYAIENSLIDIPKNNNLAGFLVERYIGESVYLPMTLPKVMPWYTPLALHLIAGYQENFDTDNLYKSIEEAIATEDVITIQNVGWNPSVELNEWTLKLARNRNIEWFNENPIYVFDISGITESDETTDMVPIYLIINNPIPYSDDLENTKEYVSRKDNFNAVGVSFDSDFNNIYMLGNEEPLITQINYFDYFEIVAIFVPREAYDEIRNDINNTATKQYTNIFDFLAKNTDIMDRNKEKLVYASIVDRIYNSFGLDHNFYRVFKGKLDEFNGNRIKEIENILITGKK